MMSEEKYLRCSFVNKSKEMDFLNLYVPYNRFFVEHPNIFVILKAHLPSVKKERITQAKVVIFSLLL